MKSRLARRQGAERTCAANPPTCTAPSSTGPATVPPTAARAAVPKDAAPTGAVCAAPPGRAGKVCVTGHFAPEGRRQLERLAADAGTAAHGPLAEAPNELLPKHGMPEIADSDPWVFCANVGHHRGAPPARSGFVRLDVRAGAATRSPRQVVELSRWKRCLHIRPRPAGAGRAWGSSVVMGDPSPRFPRHSESAAMLHDSPSTHFALPSDAAAAACRFRQRPRARFAARCGFSEHRFCFPPWQGCSAQASASSRRTTVQAGSIRRTIARLPAAPDGFRAAAAWPCDFARAPVAMRRGPPCLRGASARTARLPRCGTWSAL